MLRYIARIFVESSSDFNRIYSVALNYYYSTYMYDGRIIGTYNIRQAPSMICEHYLYASGRLGAI